MLYLYQLNYFYEQFEEREVLTFEGLYAKKNALCIFILYGIYNFRVGK